MRGERGATRAPKAESPLARTLYGLRHALRNARAAGRNRLCSELLDQRRARRRPATVWLAPWGPWETPGSVQQFLSSSCPSRQPEVCAGRRRADASWAPAGTVGDAAASSRRALDYPKREWRPERRTPFRTRTLTPSQALPSHRAPPAEGRAHARCARPGP